MPKEILLTVVEYAIRIIILVVGTYIIRFVRQHDLEKWVKFCVQAAEQIFDAPGLGKEKKEYVRQRITEKYKISEDDLDILIEAAVEELNRVKKNEQLNSSTLID